MASRFARVPPEVASDDRLTGRALRVFIAVCSYAITADECFPSLATLAKVTSIDRRKIPGLLKELELYGWLRRERRQDRNGDADSTKYTIRYTETVSPSAGTGVPIQGDTPVPVGGATVSPPAGLPGVPVGGALRDINIKRSIKEISREGELFETNEPKAKKTRKPSVRVQLPADTILTDEWRNLIAEQRPDLDPGRVFTRFKRYWTDPDILEQPRSSKSKAGWLRAWENWIERERNDTRNQQSLNGDADTRRPGQSHHRQSSGGILAAARSVLSESKMD